MNKLRRILSLPYFPLIVLPFILLSPVLLAGKALFWGTPALQFIPWWTYAWDTLLAGHLPLWNPHLGMGAPLVANLQSALFYPPNWVYFVFYGFGGITAMAWAQALMTALHLVLSGLGMALLTHRIGGGKVAQTVSGLAFSLSGYLVARAWFASINSAVAWLPWILLFSLDLLIPKKRVSALIKLAALFGVQLLAGHAQTSWYSGLLAAIWVGFWAWQTGERKISQRIRAVAQGWGFLAIAILLGVLIAGVQLFPTAEYLSQSPRASAAEYEAAMVYSFWPWRFIGLLAPNFFGNPAQGNYWGYANFWEDAIYIGFLPLLLSLGVLLKFVFKPKSPTTNHQPPTLAGFLFTLIILSFLLALGQNTPIFPWLYRHIPTFDMFRAPTRFSIWAIFSLALLAGIGCERWRRPAGRSLYWTRLGTAAAFAVTLGAGLGWFFLKDVAVDFKPTFVPALAMMGLWGLGAGILSLTARPVENKKSSKIWEWAVVFWVCIDLLVAGWGLNPGIRLDFYAHQPTNLTNLREMAGNNRIYLLPKDEDQIKFRQYFKFETFDPGQDWNNLRAMQLPNLNMIEGISMVNNYDPLVPARYARWMEEIRNLYIYFRQDLLKLMDVSVLEWESESQEIGVRFAPIEDPARVRWLPCARFVSAEEDALSLILSGEIDLASEVIIESDRSTPDQICYAKQPPIQMLSDGPNRILIQLETQAPGWLVLSDVWYPGWQARVDGQIVIIQRANYLFRGVELPAGDHEIEFLYRPISFYLGLVASLTSCLGFLVMGSRLKKRTL